MSKSSTLKVKHLFRLKTPDKDTKEVGAPGPSPENRDPASPTEKKKKRLLTFRLKRRKSKQKEEDGDVGEVFFSETDEVDSVSSHL